MQTREKASDKAKANQCKRQIRDANLHHFAITRKTALGAQNSKSRYIPAASKAHATARMISHDILLQNSKHPLAHLSSPTDILPRRDGEKTVKAISWPAAIKYRCKSSCMRYSGSLVATLQALIKVSIPTSTLYNPSTHTCSRHAGDHNRFLIFTTPSSSLCPQLCKESDLIMVKVVKP